MSEHVFIDRIPSYQFFSAPRDTTQDTEQGKRDGKINFPPEGQKDFTPYEIGVVSKGKGDVTDYCQKAHKKISLHQTRVAHLESYRDSQLRNELNDLHTAYGADLDKVNRNGAASDVMYKLKEKLFNAEARYKDVKNSEDERELDVHMHKPVAATVPILRSISQYMAIMLLLGVVEYFINADAFKDMIQNNSLMSVGGAIIVGCIIIVIAHLIGMFFRQRKSGKNKGSLVRGLSMLVLLGMAMFLITRLSIARYRVNSAPGNGANIVTSAKTATPQLPDNISGIFWPSGVSLDDVSMLLLAINIAILVAGIFLSYIRHDPNPDYERVYKSYEIAKTEVDNINAQYERDKGVLEEGFKLKLKALNERFDQITNEVAVEKERVGQYNDQINSEIENVIQVITTRISAYQNANKDERARNSQDAGMPLYFAESTEARVRQIIKPS